MNTRTLPSETVVVELEPWEARRLQQAFWRILRKGGQKPGLSEFALSEKVVMRKLMDALGEF